MDLYKRTEALLYNYKTMKAEIKNLELDIENIEYIGCGSISYEEKSAPTNQFSSSVENEVISRDKKRQELEQSKREKETIIKKIDNALGTLDQRELKLICLRYFDKVNNRTIAAKVDLTEQWSSTLNTDIINRLSKLIN